ncbi:Flp pilus assembly protein CpaB [Vibrio sp. JC009]|uniref:Flp pilus assembly protein CpaB n=1 Tax=Vibrio sp. JC009 TaxID=2912314 RepID=UPI0023B171EE|nr:Flp pilus assembly protein CpaB [Vibrio sp. JC009]WED21277.1 Flp pilus assembly protein CpaB [Vibrio sp. JC009]
MNRTQVIFLFLLSIIFGLAAVFVGKQWMDQQRQPEVEVEVVERHPVVIAGVNIPAGVEITSEQLTTKLLEVAWLNQEANFANLEDVVGMVARDAIYAGEVMHASRISEPGVGTTLAALIPENKRAVTIRVNDVVGVAGFLLPGSKVDILQTVKYGKNSASTTTVLKNIKVLAVDQTARTEENKPIIVRAVTLEVTPKEAQKLLSANSKGSIQLALRNPHEVDKPVVRTTYKPKPSVTIIKGTKSSNVKVKE